MVRQHNLVQLYTQHYYNNQQGRYFFGIEYGWGIRITSVLSWRIYWRRGVRSEVEPGILHSTYTATTSITLIHYLAPFFNHYWHLLIILI